MQARRRVGAAPLRWLFDLLRGPAPGIGTVGVWWRGLLGAAIDGTVAAVPDSPANLYVLPSTGATTASPGTRRCGCWSGLVCSGTRTLMDAVFGPTTDGETVYAWIMAA